MSKKHSIRRSAAGILAVLTVTGNLIAPAQFRFASAPAAIEAEAATINSSNAWNHSGIAWDAATGTLTIKKGITNAEGAVGQDHPDQIYGDLHTSFFSTISYSKVKHIVIADGATLPKSWYHLFQNFTNLESLVVQESVDASNVYDFGWTFAGLTKLETVDLSGLTNVTTVDYIENMFNGCSSIKVIDLSMLTGDNAGMREWSKHVSIDHIKKAIAGCNQIEDLNLTGEYLYNLVENVKSQQGSRIGNIDNILDEMLADNTSPHIGEIRQRLRQRYLDYAAAIADLHQWRPGAWHWDTDAKTCTVDVKKLKDDATGRHPEKDPNNWAWQYGLPCFYEYSVDPAPTCTDEGTKLIIAKWTNTDVDPNVTYTNDEKLTESVDALGHVFEAAGFEWAEDLSSAKLVEVCSRCDAERRTDAVVSCEHFDATCTQAEYAVYTAACNGLKEEKTVNDISPALGHQFTVPAWAWDGYSSAVLTLSCARENCSENVTVTDVEITSEITAEPTCTETGIRTYKATAVYNGVTYTNEKEEVLPAAEHTYGEPEWNWANDASYAEAVFTCQQNDSTLTLDAEIGEPVVTVEATCTGAGTVLYTAAVTFNGETYEDTKEIVTPATDHTPGEAVRENFHDSTCTEEGSYEMVTYCTGCGEVMFREPYTIPMKEHVYGEPAWTWENDASSASAAFTCSGCGDVQTVDAVIGEGVVSQEPGLATEGTMTYTATAIFNDVEYTDTMDVAIAPTFIIKQNHTLLVNGKIGVNYLVQFADGVENPVMTAWHTQDNGEWVKTEIAGKHNLNDDGEWDGRYRFTYMVAAPEMTDTIYCTYAATLNGTEVSTDAEDPFTYSVQAYLDGRMQKSADEKMRTLAAYMATYGSYAQRYFDVNTDNLADANVESLYGAVTVDTSFVNTDAAEQVIEDSIENATAEVASHSLILDAATTLRYIVTLEDESVLPDAYLAYRVAGSEEDFKYAKIVRNKREDGSFRLIADIVGIKAPDMTDAYEAYVCVKNGSAYEQISLTTIYSPECYIASRLEKSSNETLKSTLTALMMYCHAAREYFGLDAVDPDEEIAEPAEPAQEAPAAEEPSEEIPFD